jgi:hypothetical protein
MCLPLLPEIICFYDNNISQVCQVEASAYTIRINIAVAAKVFSKRRRLKFSRQEVMNVFEAPFRYAWAGTGFMAAALTAGAFTFPVSMSHWISSCMVSR